MVPQDLLEEVAAGADRKGEYQEGPILQSVPYQFLLKTLLTCVLQNSSPLLYTINKSVN